MPHCRYGGWKGDCRLLILWGSAYITHDWHQCMPAWVTFHVVTKQTTYDQCEVISEIRVFRRVLLTVSIWNTQAMRNTRSWMWMEKFVCRLYIRLAIFRSPLYFEPWLSIWWGVLRSSVASTSLKTDVWMPDMNHCWWRYCMQNHRCHFYY